MKKLILICISICMNAFPQTSVVFDSVSTFEVFWRPPLPIEPKLRYNIYINPGNRPEFVVQRTDTLIKFHGSQLKDTTSFRVTAIDTADNEGPFGNTVWAYYVLYEAPPSVFIPKMWHYRDLIRWTLRPGGLYTIKENDPDFKDGFWMFGNQRESSIHTTVDFTQDTTYAFIFDGSGEFYLNVNNQIEPVKLNNEKKVVFMRLERGRKQVMIHTLKRMFLRSVEIRVAKPDMTPPGAPPTGIR